MQANVDGNAERLCYGKWRRVFLHRPIQPPQCAQIDVGRGGAHDFSSTSIPPYPIFILSLAFILIPFFWKYLHFTAERRAAEPFYFCIWFCICHRQLSVWDLLARFLACFLTECLLAKLGDKKNKKFWKEINSVLSVRKYFIWSNWT